MGFSLSIIEAMRNESSVPLTITKDSFCSLWAKNEVTLLTTGANSAWMVYWRQDGTADYVDVEGGSKGLVEAVEGLLTRNPELKRASCAI